MYSTIEKYNHYPYSFQATENYKTYNLDDYVTILFLYFCLHSVVNLHRRAFLMFMYLCILCMRCASNKTQNQLVNMTNEFPQLRGYLVNIE